MAEGDKEKTSDKNLRLYGTRIPNVEDKKRVEAYLKAADQAYMNQGGSEPIKDGLNELGQPVSTMGMSSNDAFFAKGRALDKKQLEGYKSFGDKYRGEAINAVRELTGRAPIANTPQEFEGLVNKSLKFGTDSALNTPEGRQRAISQGIGAGLSAEDATARVQSAYDTLQKMSKTVGAAKIGTAGATAVEPYGPPKELMSQQTTSRALPQPTTPEQKTIEQETRENIVQNVVEPVLGGESRSGIMQAGQVAKGLTGIARAYEAAKKADLANLNKITQGKPIADLATEAKTLQQAATQAGAKVPAMQRLAKGALVGSPLAKGLQTVTDAADVAAKAASEGTKTLTAATNIPEAQKALDTASKVTGNKLIKGLGRFGAVATVAEPAVETFKYFRDPELLDKKIEEIADIQEKGLGATVGKTVLDVTPVPAQAFNPNYSPVGTLAATIGSPFEQTRRLREAEGDLATAQMQKQLGEKRSAELLKLRQEMFPDSTRENTTREEAASQMDKVREAYKKLRTQRK